MNLRDYLTRHDGKARTDGPELIRLATAAGISSYYLYLTALGHKRVGQRTAENLAAASIGGQLEAWQVNKKWPDVFAAPAPEARDAA